MRTYFLELVAVMNLWVKLSIFTNRREGNVFRSVCESLSGGGGFPACITGHTAADPGFPRGGLPTLPRGRQHTILPNFPKNCMKLKKFGPVGGMHPSHPLTSDTVIWPGGLHPGGGLHGGSASGRPASRESAWGVGKSLEVCLKGDLHSSGGWADPLIMTPSGSHSCFNIVSTQGADAGHSRVEDNCAEYCVA